MCSMFLSKFQHGCFPTAIVLLRESATCLEIVLFSFKRWCISLKNAWYVARTFRATCYFLSEVLYSWNGYALHFWNKQCIFTCRETHYLVTTWNLMNIDIVKKIAYANKECWSLSSMLLGVVWRWQVDSLAAGHEVKNLNQQIQDSRCKIQGVERRSEFKNFFLDLELNLESWIQHSSRLQTLANACSGISLEYYPKIPR